MSYCLLEGDFFPRPIDFPPSTRIDPAQIFRSRTIFVRRWKLKDRQMFAVFLHYFKPKESQFFQVLRDPCVNKSSLLFAALGIREEEREELLKG